MLFYVCFAFGPPRSLALASCGLMLPSGTATTSHPPPTTFLHIILSLKCPCFFSSNESQQKRSIMKRLESGLRVSSTFLYKILFIKFVKLFYFGENFNEIKIIQKKHDSWSFNSNPTMYLTWIS